MLYRGRLDSDSYQEIGGFTAMTLDTNCGHRTLRKALSLVPDYLYATSTQHHTSFFFLFMRCLPKPPRTLRLNDHLLSIITVGRQIIHAAKTRFLQARTEYCVVKYSRTDLKLLKFIMINMDPSPVRRIINQSINQYSQSLLNHIILLPSCQPHNAAMGK